MALLGPRFKWTIPVAAYILSIVCPTVPAFVWTDILNAVNNGDIITADILAFMAAKGIKTYSAPEDFPEQAKSGMENQAGISETSANTNINKT